MPCQVFPEPPPDTSTVPFPPKNAPSNTQDFKCVAWPSDGQGQTNQYAGGSYLVVRVESLRSYSTTQRKWGIVLEGLKNPSRTVYGSLEVYLPVHVDVDFYVSHTTVTTNVLDYNYALYHKSLRDLFIVNNNQQYSSAQNLVTNVNNIYTFVGSDNRLGAV